MILVLAVTAVMLVVMTTRGSACFASGPLVDPLDSQPLSWRLTESDMPAELHTHWLDAAGGQNGRPCEALTLSAGSGTRILLEYRIEPSMLLDEVRASVAVWSAKQGPSMGLRVRYPHVIDPSTRAPFAAYIWGAPHEGRGAWQRLSVRPDKDERQRQQMGMRSRFGADADTRDAYIDALVLNAYGGPGTTTLRIDNLRVDGLLPAQAIASPGGRDGERSASLASRSSSDAQTSGRPRSETVPRGASLPDAPPGYQGRSAVRSAFPPGRVTRVIEYNGEQLDYLRLLGFDAVLLPRPPTADVLRAAMRENLTVYAPPPATPDPSLEPFLSAVGGWYLGTATDETQLEYIAQDAARLEALPAPWARPLMVAPAEQWDRYAGVATTVFYDLPLTQRGLGGREEIDVLRDQQWRTGRPVIAGAAVATQPPQRLVTQLRAIAQSLGATDLGDFGWRPMHLQIWRALATAPRAILYRSSSSLSTGQEQDARRATVMALNNLWLEVVGPWIAQAHRSEPLVSSRGDYVTMRMSGDSADLILAIRETWPTPAPGDERGTVRSVDAPLRIGLPGTANQYAWRITHATSEQIALTGQLTDRRMEIENPDLIEWVLVTSDPSLGGRLAGQLRSRAQPLIQHRWQMVGESLMRTRGDWQSAASTGLVPATAIPNDLLRTAANLLSPVQTALAQQEYGEAMRAVRGADEMTLRCEAMLRSRLMPVGVSRTGMPTLLAPGGVVLHTAWLPGLEDGRWSRNLLAGGDLDDADTMMRSGWTSQSRLTHLATSTIGLEIQAGEELSGALRIESLARGDTALAGGYAGTVTRVRSAPIQFAPGSWVRIRARIKTLGFGGPNQGLLVYDSDAGSELGQLERGDGSWTTVQLFRLITSDRPFRVTFEGIGSGEALVDWVEVSMWQPPVTQPLFTPINPG